MKSYIIKCKRTHWVITFELCELVLFQKQFNFINGFDKLFTDYYEFIDESSITSGYSNSNKGNKPQQSLQEHEALNTRPSIKCNESSDPPEILNLLTFFILDI